MDFFFHALLPYFLGSYFKLERKLLAALVLGGIAPDLDAFISWVSSVYPTTVLLVHRGITHSLLFGFIFALMLLYICTTGPVRSRLVRLIKFDLDLSLSSMAFVCAGVLLHLAVDYTTTRGVPLLYPWEAARYSADIFSQLELAVLAASLAVLVVLWRQRAQPKFNKNLFIIFLAYLLIVGGIRMEGKESAQDFFEQSGEKVEVHPDFGLFSWMALGSDGGQFQVYRYSLLQNNLTCQSAYPRLAVASSQKEAEEAIALAERLPQVNVFRWRAYAVAVNATSRENGSWEIEYYDPLVKLQMDGANQGSFFRPRPPGYGSVKVALVGGEARMVRE
jgi:inner membrane protein